MEFRHERWKLGLLHAASDFDPTNWEINFIGETLFQFTKKIYIPPHKPFAPSTGRGGMVQNAMMSRRALIDSSSFVRSAGGLEPSLFAAINDLILKYEGGITKCSSSCFRSWIGNSMRLRLMQTHET